MYAASDLGAMGRPVVGFGRSVGQAILNCETLLRHQESECYAWEQSMSHLSISNEIDGGRYQ